MRRATTIAITIVEKVITLGIAIKKRSKVLLPKMKQHYFRAIILQQAIEKRPILLAQYLKNEQFERVPTIISHFRGHQ